MKRRQFDSKRLAEALPLNSSIMMSWGISKIVCGDSMLTLTVNGFKFKGDVIILLDYDDTFIIKCGEQKTVDGVYISELVNTIDELIEKTDDYERDVKEWLKNNT